MLRLTARPLAILCLSSALWAFSFGLGAPLASLWLWDATPSGALPGLATAVSVLGRDTVIGLNTSVYYVGIALAAGLVPRMMRRWGRGCAAAGMVASGLTTLGLPWSGSLGIWFGLRFLNGIAGAMSLIPLETFVNRHSAPEKRARNFGFYAFAVALGWALGSLVGLQMYADAPRLAFAGGGLAGVLAGVNLFGFLPWPREPVEGHQRSASLAFRRNFLSFGSAWSQGFLEGGMVAFLAVYLRYLGLSDARVGWLTSGIMVGVLLFQVPIAWLADHLGRTSVLLGCYAATAIGLGFLPYCSAASSWLGPGLFLVGACSGAFYPLGLAILGERLPQARMARASAWYLAINCCGSLLGPAVMGTAMDRFGEPTLFLVGEAAVLGVLCVWAVTRSPLCGRGQEADAAETLAPPAPLRRSA
jgi:MFS family permease